MRRTTRASSAPLRSSQNILGEHKPTVVNLSVTKSVDEAECFELLRPWILSDRRADRQTDRLTCLSESAVLIPHVIFELSVSVKDIVLLLNDISSVHNSIGKYLDKEFEQHSSTTLIQHLQAVLSEINYKLEHGIYERSRLRYPPRTCVKEEILYDNANKGQRYCCGIDYYSNHLLIDYVGVAICQSNGSHYPSQIDGNYSSDKKAFKFAARRRNHSDKQFTRVLRQVPPTDFQLICMPPFVDVLHSFGTQASSKSSALRPRSHQPSVPGLINPPSPVSQPSVLGLISLPFPVSSAFRSRSHQPFVLGLISPPSPISSAFRPQSHQPSVPDLISLPSPVSSALRPRSHQPSVPGLISLPSPVSSAFRPRSHQPSVFGIIRHSSSTLSDLYLIC
ncbi:hypothetical protein J6590_005224 [Homalodisca vitripennis]|nr:hypothetical protein J6590_005224 [Homalodisca vitripennis]